MLIGSIGMLGWSCVTMESERSDSASCRLPRLITPVGGRSTVLAPCVPPPDPGRIAIPYLAPGIRSRIGGQFDSLTRPFATVVFHLDLFSPALPSRGSATSNSTSTPRHPDHLQHSPVRHLRSLPTGHAHGPNSSHASAHTAGCAHRPLAADRVPLLCATVRASIADESVRQLHQHSYRHRHHVQL